MVPSLVLIFLGCGFAKPPQDDKKENKNARLSVAGVFGFILVLLDAIILIIL